MIAAFGGGDNTAVALEAALARGKEVHYTPAEMHIEIALKQASIKQQTPPSDFWGSAFKFWTTYHQANNCAKTMGDLN